MSYLTMIPNYLNNNQFSYPNQAYINPNSLQNNNLLILISSALKNSINSYAHFYQPTEQNKPQPTVSTQEIIQISDCQKNLSESHSSQHNILKNTVIINDMQSKNNTLTKPFIIEPKIRKQPRVSTDDQFIVEQKQKKIRKTITKARKSKQVKEGKEGSSIVVPEVDLIDTAYIPPMKSDYCELMNKRQALLKRKVVDWSQFCKVKKEKRQIRNLIN